MDYLNQEFYRLNKDARETRNNVNLDELSETIYLCTESVEDEYIYKESLQKDFIIQEAAIKTYEQLTPIQKRRFYKAKVLGMSTYEIAQEEGGLMFLCLKALSLRKRSREKHKRKKMTIKLISGINNAAVLRVFGFFV